jgi:hypothetical protein
MPWRDHPDNPLLRPRWWSWIVGDPSLLSPAQTPDGSWRMFCNNVQGIYHYRSEDGLSWRLVQRIAAGGFRAWALVHEGTTHLWYQRFHSLWRRSVMVHRSSRDLERWTEPTEALRPELPWEGAHVSNACVLPAPEGGWWMYYSADQVFLKDMGFWEPKHISRAWAPAPEGPWEKHGEPVLGPEPGHRFRDAGAGAIKVYGGLLEGAWAGFQNGIYKDERGRSASAILLLRSPNGLSWEEHPDNPIIAPSGDEPRWRRAHVYQMDVKRVGDALWMYYNARDGWMIGVERVGLAILDDARELWAGAPTRSGST